MIRMETTRNELSPYANSFFTKLSNHIDKKIYFFGSVQRADYFKNASDIDVDIFTDNERSTLFHIQRFLDVDKNQIYKFVYTTRKKQLVKGYKIKYTDEFNNFNTEILIFNEKHKDAIIQEHTSKFTLPVYISVLLVILKFIYYKLHLLPKKTFTIMKNKLMDRVDNTMSSFIVIGVLN